MKIIPALACLGMLFYCASSVSAAGAFYIRPSVQYTKVSVATDEYTGGKIGYGIAAGYTLGTNRSFSLELEAVSTSGLKAHTDKRYYGATGTVDETLSFSQYLLGFRYTVLPKDCAIRFFVGPSAGYWTTKNKSVSLLHTSSSTTSTTSNFSEQGVLLGPTLGAAVKVNDRIRIEVAYRLLWMLTSDASNGHLAKQSYVSCNYVF